jgi:hypothetical protein
LAFPQVSGGYPGNIHQFTFHFTDPLGPSDISGGQIAFNMDTRGPNAPVCQLDWYTNGNIDITGLAYGSFGRGSLSSTYCNVYTAESGLVQTAQGYDVSIVVSFPEPLPNPLLPAWTRGITKAGGTGAWVPVGAHSLSPHMVDLTGDFSAAPLYCGGVVAFDGFLTRYSDGTISGGIGVRMVDLGEAGGGWQTYARNGQIFSSSSTVTPLATSATSAGPAADTNEVVLPVPAAGTSYPKDPCIANPALPCGGKFYTQGDYEVDNQSCWILVAPGFPGFSTGHAALVYGYKVEFDLSGTAVDPTPIIDGVSLTPDLVSGGTATMTIFGRNLGASGSLTFSSSDITYDPTGAACGSAGVVWGTWQIQACVQASPNALGNYTVQVVSGGGVSGNGFQQGTPTQSSKSSNPFQFLVKCSPYVTIGSRPISISPGPTLGTYTATLTGVAWPPGGVYTWSTNNPSMVGFSTPSTGPSANQVTLAIISTNDKATITLTYISPCGGTATDSFTFALTNDTTVVAWLDPGPIGPGNSQLSPLDPVYQDLVNNSSTCVSTLAGWAFNGRTGAGQANNGLTPQEIQFAIEFLNAGSGNHPPSNPNTSAYVNGQDYRLYQRFQAYYEITNGAINSATVKYLWGGPLDALSGVTPEPCTGFQILSVASQPNPRNGEFGLTSDGSLVYQLNEGRVGTNGQQVNQFLNGPVGGDWTLTTPWIWSTIQFDANGKTRAWVQGANLQIFPAYQVFTNGSPVPYPLGSFPDSLANLVSFVALNATSQYTGPSK